MFSASRGFPSLKLPNNKKRSELLVRQLRPFFLFLFLFVPGPVIGAADGLIPALDALGAFLFRDVRAEHAVHRPVAGDVLGGLPVAYGEAGQIGRTQRRRFHTAGALDFEVADVGHGLHEVVVGRRAAVHPERLHGGGGRR